MQVWENDVFIWALREKPSKRKYERHARWERDFFLQKKSLGVTQNQGFHLARATRMKNDFAKSEFERYRRESQNTQGGGGGYQQIFLL